jgi:hypothetical protein
MLRRRGNDYQEREKIRPGHFSTWSDPGKILLFSYFFLKQEIAQVTAMMGGNYGYTSLYRTRHLDHLKRVYYPNV